MKIEKEDKIRELEELNADLESTNQEYQEQIEYYENNNE